MCVIIGVFRIKSGNPVEIHLLLCYEGSRIPVCYQFNDAIVSMDP